MYSAPNVNPGQVSSHRRKLQSNGVLVQLDAAGRALEEPQAHKYDGQLQRRLLRQARALCMLQWSTWPTACRCFGQKDFCFGPPLRWWSARSAASSAARRSARAMPSARAQTAAGASLTCDRLLSCRTDSGRPRGLCGGPPLVRRWSAVVRRGPPWSGRSNRGGPRRTTADQRRTRMPNQAPVAWPRFSANQGAALATLPLDP